MYKFETTDSFDKEFRKLDKSNARMILKYIKNSIMTLENPKDRGKALVVDKKGLWRYRIGDYRLICKIEYARLLFLALNQGHRRDL